MSEKNIKYRTSPLVTRQNTTNHDKSLKSQPLEPLNGTGNSPQSNLTKPEQILQRFHRRAVEKNGGSPKKGGIWCQNGVKLRQSPSALLALNTDSDYDLTENRDAPAGGVQTRFGAKKVRWGFHASGC